VAVCLSGTGADELFGGYSRFVESKRLSQMLSLPRIAKSAIFHMFKMFGGQVDKAYKLKELLSCTEEYELYLKLFSDLFRNKEDFPVDFNKVRHLKGLMNERDDLSSKLNFEQQIYLPFDLLVKEDRACMANSLEGRIPFLDPEIIEFANSLPSEFKINKGITKYILKDAYNQVIPNQNLYRTKRGFGMPLREYLKKELKEYASEIIFDKAVYPFYDKKIVADLWGKHQKGMNDYSSFFWRIIVFNKWYDRWM